MISYTEAENGPATLADVARMNQYLDMVSDVETAEMDAARAKKGGSRRW